jgi:hypothetical protein
MFKVNFHNHPLLSIYLTTPVLSIYISHYPCIIHIYIATRAPVLSIYLTTLYYLVYISRDQRRLEQTQDGVNEEKS